MKKTYIITTFYTLIVSILTAGKAFAEPGIRPWQLGLQEAATPVMEQLTEFHNLLMIIVTATTVFVLLLLGYICIRFNAKNNPKPSKTSHNSVLEVIWTTIPIIILLIIAIPSFKSLYYINTTPETELTLKVTGYQWYWGYQYPEHDISYDSYIIQDKKELNGEPYLLAVDNKVVVPVDTNVKVLITGADVIHNWAMPAFGLKTDAIPGRVNETWFRATKKGVFYGQCSELCGTGHGFMPIAINVVSKEEFKQWLTHAKQKYAHKSTNFSVASATK